MKKFGNYRKIAVWLIPILIACIINQYLAAKDISEHDRTKVNIDTIIYQPALQYKLSKFAVDNEIVDNQNLLYQFFEKLNNLRTQDEEINAVTVIHLGDSHIQADFLTGTVRKLMHQYFGNPGRGLVAPNRLMKSNNGLHYKITSPNQWSHSFVMKPNHIPIGIAGIGLQIKDTIAHVNLLTMNSDTCSSEWYFDRITAYCDCDDIDIQMPNASILHSDCSTAYARTFVFDSLINDINLNFYSPGKREINLFGFNLSNGKKGVFYHSIGINGARYGDFCDQEIFHTQLSSLNPELVIISFGTNEAMAKVINEANLYARISELAYYINHQSPNAIIMLTTPSETYTRNRSAPNAQIGKVRNVIVEFAEKNGYPYWDLYKITGGRGSALSWNKKQLMTKDKIHLTPQGYEYQGQLLFEAFIKSYNNYIKEKHGL